MDFFIKRGVFDQFSLLVKDIPVKIEWIIEIFGCNLILSIQDDLEKSGNTDLKGIYTFGRWIEKLLTSI